MTRRPTRSGASSSKPARVSMSRRSPIRPSISRSWCLPPQPELPLLLQQPGQRFGHRAQQRALLLSADRCVGEQAEGRREGRVLSLVPHLAMLRPPRYERRAGFGHAEKRAAHLVPGWAAVGLLDGMQRSLFGLTEFGQPMLADVLVPTLRHALDARRGED